MFSMTIEYALRAASYLTDSRHRRVTSQIIAGECKVPVSYMSKVLQAMAEAGLITSQRGPSGGFALAKAPSEITMLDVVDAIDPIARSTESPHEEDQPSAVLSPLYREMDAMNHLIIDHLASRTLESLMTEPAEPVEVKVIVQGNAQPQPVATNRVMAGNRIGVSDDAVDAEPAPMPKARPLR